MSKKRKDALAAFVGHFRDLLAQQGAVVASCRGCGVKRSGPYFRLVCRDEHGRQRSVYLGKDGFLVAEARDLLAALQRDHLHGRLLERAKKNLRRALRDERRQADQHLHVAGLTRRGTEVRGWRAADRSGLLRLALSGAAPGVNVSSATLIPENRNSVDQF